MLSLYARFKENEGKLHEADADRVKASALENALNDPKGALNSYSYLVYHGNEKGLVEAIDELSSDRKYLLKFMKDAREKFNDEVGELAKVLPAAENLKVHPIYSPINPETFTVYAVIAADAVLSGLDKTIFGNPLFESMLDAHSIVPAIVGAVTTSLIIKYITSTKPIIKEAHIQAHELCEAARLRRKYPEKDPWGSGL